MSPFESCVYADVAPFIFVASNFSLSFLEVLWPLTIISRSTFYGFIKSVS